MSLRFLTVEDTFIVSLKGGSLIVLASWLASGLSWTPSSARHWSPTSVFFCSPCVSPPGKPDSSNLYHKGWGFEGSSDWTSRRVTRLLCGTANKALSEGTLQRRQRRQKMQKWQRWQWNDHSFHQCKKGSQKVKLNTSFKYSRIMWRKKEEVATDDGALHTRETKGEKKREEREGKN